MKLQTNYYEQECLSLIFCVLLLAACQSGKDANEEHDHRQPATTVSEDEAQSKKSISKEAHAQVGDVHIAINYHSPAVRGRVIWGGLVPYDEVWLTGAHNATSISFSKEININGVTVPEGKYAFFTIPGKEQWTLILNKNWNQHLADDYDVSKDIVRVNVTPETGLPLS